MSLPEGTQQGPVSQYKLFNSRGFTQADVSSSHTPEEKAIFKYLRFVFKQRKFSMVVFNTLRSVVELFLTTLVHIPV